MCPWVSARDRFRRWGAFRHGSAGAERRMTQRVTAEKAARIEGGHRPHGRPPNGTDPTRGPGPSTRAENRNRNRAQVLRKGTENKSKDQGPRKNLDGPHID